MAEPLLKIDGLSAGYGAKTVLEGASLDLGKGETVALLGPNGCGKTTLLRVLCGDLPARAGSVTVAGRGVHTLSARERARLMAYVPQGEDHAFDFTVREIVLMGRLSHSVGLYETQEDHEAARRAMAEADCLQFADRPLSSLSGGEAQRALIARALAQETPLLLCDEPTTHLDPKHQVEVLNLILALRNSGRALLVTTHDLNLARAFCDRAVFLSSGRIRYDGSIEGALSNGVAEEVYGVAFRLAKAGDVLYANPY